MKRILVMSTLMLLSFSIYASFQSTSFYTIKEWNPNWKVNLPESIQNDSLSGSAWFNLEFNRKTLKITKVRILYINIQNRISNKKIYEYRFGYKDLFVSDQYSNQIKEYKSYLLKYCKKLTIVKTDTSNSDMTVKNELGIGFTF
jgi:hypothetical protein